MAAENVLEVEARLKDFISQNLKTVENNLKEFAEKAKKTNDAAAKSTNALKKAFGGVKDSIVKFAKQFGPAAIATMVLAKATTALKNAINFVKEATTGFEKTMSKAKAVLEPTADEFKNLSNQAKSLGESTVFSASQAGEAFVEMGKLGQNANEIIASSEGVLNLAALAQVEMAEAAKVTVQTLNQFQLDASQANNVVDIMAKSFNTTALDINKFSNAMTFAGAVAGSTGEGIEDVTAAIGVLADRGIEGSLAGTAMRQIMLQLADSTSLASKTVKEYNPNAQTLTEKLQALNQAGLGVTKTTEMFGLRATTAAQVLIRESEAVEDLSKKFQDSDGTAQRFSKTMLDNVAGATTKLKSAQEALGIALGEAFSGNKLENIKLYTRLTLRAKDAAIAHKQEITDFVGSIGAVFRFLVSVISKFSGVFLGVMDLILSGFFTMVEKTWVAVRGVAKAFNWVSKKLKGKEVFDLSFINAQVDEFSESAQRAADNAFSAITGAAFNIEKSFAVTAKAAKDANTQIKNMGDDAVDTETKLKTLKDAISTLKENIKLLKEDIKGVVAEEKALSQALSVLNKAKISLLPEGDRAIAEVEEKFRQLEEKYAEHKDALKVISIAKDIEITEAENEQNRQRIDSTVQMLNQIGAATNNIGSQLIALSRTRRQNELADRKAEIAAMNISEKEREKLLKAAEKANADAAKKEKAIAIGQAIISTALAITNALSVKPTPLGIVMAALVGAAGAAQIATIASQSFAAGTGFAPGGQAIVGEQGAELVFGPKAGFLPRGSTVINNQETRNLLGGNSVNLNINIAEGAVVDADAADLMFTRAEKLRDELVYAVDQGILDLNRVQEFA